MSQPDHERRQYNYEPSSPIIDPSAFIAANATVVGYVSIGPESSVWFGVVVRGDVEEIEIGSQTNIQDQCVLHADPRYPCRIGDRVSVGHGAIVHGAIVEDDVLVGIRAVVLNGATIGEGSIVAAGCVVPEGFEVPPNSVVMGVPARVVRSTSVDDRQRHQATVRNYVAAAKAVPPHLRIRASSQN